MEPYNTEKFEHNGYQFVASFYYDEDMGEPWKEHDGHGEVSGWTTRDKGPGELVLASDRYSKRFYDFAETLKVAERDGWGIGDEKVMADLERRYGRKLTAKETTKESVMLDFKHLQDWCNDQWHWCGVTVKLVGPNVAHGFEQDEFSYACWGIESEDDEHLMYIARECADEVIHDYQKFAAGVLA